MTLPFVPLADVGTGWALALGLGIAVLGFVGVALVSGVVAGSVVGVRGVAGWLWHGLIALATMALLAKTDRFPLESAPAVVGFGLVAAGVAAILQRLAITRDADRPVVRRMRARPWRIVLGAVVGALGALIVAVVVNDNRVVGVLVTIGALSGAIAGATTRSRGAVRQPPDNRPIR